MLALVTDDRSAKYAHLTAEKGGLSSPMEACWWLDEAGVQFRIAGRAIVATARSDDAVLRGAVEDAWARLGPSGRRTFFWP